MFKVSDKVVCVDDSKSNYALAIPGDWISRGTIYVIRELVPDGGNWSPDPSGYGFGVRVVGICGGFYWDGEEARWNCLRFRKLEDIKEENRVKNHVTERTPQKVS